MSNLYPNKNEQNDQRTRNTLQTVILKLSLPEGFFWFSSKLKIKELVITDSLPKIICAAKCH